MTNERLKYAVESLHIETEIVLGLRPLPDDVTIHDVIGTMRINARLVRAYASQLHEI